MNQTISVGQIIKETFSKIFANLFTLLGMTVTSIIGAGILGVAWVSGFLGILDVEGNLFSSAGYLSYLAQPSYVLELAGSQSASLYSLSAVIFFLFAYLVSNFIVSVIKVFLSPTKAAYGVFFTNSPMQVIKVAVLMFVTHVLIYLATLAFVIPGIIYGLAVSLAVFYLVVENATIKQSLQTSLQNTFGYKSKMFTFVVLITIMAFALTFLLFIGEYLLVELLSLSGGISAGLLMWFGPLLIIGFVQGIGFMLLISGFSAIYTHTKTQPPTERKPVIWPLVVAVCFGAIVYAFMIFVVPKYTTNQVDMYKQKALEAEKKSGIVRPAAYEKNTAYEAKLKEIFDTQTMTTQQGKNGPGVFTGGGLKFEYDTAWTDTGASGSAGNNKGFATFIRNSFATTTEKNTAYRGKIVIDYGYYGEEDVMSGYDFLMTYAKPKMQEEVDKGVIKRFSITRYPGKSDVGILESEWLNEDKVNVKERYYYIFVGPNRYSFRSVDDTRDFYDTDKAARVMINSLVFDDVILEYRK